MSGGLTTTWSVTAHQLYYCIRNCSGGGVTVDCDRAKLQYLRLEEWATCSDLLSAGVVAGLWTSQVVCEQALLLRVRVDSEQEDAMEEVDYLGDVPRDATDEDWAWLLAQNFLEPSPIPDPVMGAELLVGRERGLRA